MRVHTLLGAAAVLTVAAFGLPFTHPFGNPRKTPAQPRQSLLRDAKMADGARNVLVNKCADCHSDTTHWPAYTRVAPVSWLIERDVMEGRKHLNFSHWLELSDDQREVLSTEIVSEAKKGAMPLLQYRLIHRDAKLTHEDVSALLTLAPNDTNIGDAVEGDAARGRALFERRCTGCHDVESNREGPKLRGVYGQKAASIKGFVYSNPLSRSDLTWTDANLDKWLRDSDEMVPQSDMAFSVPKTQDRADLVAFLRGLN